MRQQKMPKKQRTAKKQRTLKVFEFPESFTSLKDSEEIALASLWFCKE